MTKPLDERIEEIRKQVQISFTHVSNCQEVLNAIKDGERHIVADPGTYLIQKDLIIPEDVILQTNGGEFLFEEDAGIVVKGKLQDHEQRTTFKGQISTWKNIFVVNGELDLKYAAIRNGTGRPIYDSHINEYHYGGNICSIDGTITMGKSSLITKGRAQYGAGIYSERGELHLHGIIASNYSTGEGGGLHFNQGHLEVTGSICRNSSQLSGGGINIKYGHAKISGSVCRNFVTGEGGGIFIEGDPNDQHKTTLDLTGVIADNLAKGKGAGISFLGDSEVEYNPKKIYNNIPEDIEDRRLSTLMKE